MQLDQFREAKAEEIALLTGMASRRELPRPWKGQRPDFLKAIATPPAGYPVSVIAEFQQSSPSCGELATGLKPETVAEQYAAAGASCISVLTEEQFFGGRIGYLERMSRVGLPLLRTDFIFHQLQVIETASTPASALLLIVRLTPDVRTLRILREQAEAYGMNAVVEVFDEADLEIARQSGARIIQVHARDLNTQKTDRHACLKMGEHRRDGEIWIVASGMESGEHLQEAGEAGFCAALIGTTLMKGGTPGEKLSTMLKETISIK